MNDLNLDLTRLARMGIPEIIYGEFKSVEQLRRIALICKDSDQGFLITRLQPEKACQLEGGDYDPISRTLLVKPLLSARPGLVGIVSAGTSDIRIVSEASITLKYLGIEHHTYNDLGVASLKRILSHRQKLGKCDLLICVAGFEGALASVVAGFFPGPVIGVPTSVGYGISEGGKVALGSMLSSCAGGLLVVNVDNGCGAALGAARILGRIYSNENSKD